MPAQFHRDTLADLRREGLNAATIAALENVAEQYRERRARQKAARSTGAALRRSIRARAATLLEYLKAQDSAALEFNLGELMHQLGRRQDENERGGKPRDKLRFELACGIGAAL